MDEKFIIKTPFLRLFLRYYGWFGLQIRAVKLRDPISLLNFGFNVALIVHNTYQFFNLSATDDFFKSHFNQTTESIHYRRKPLFRIAHGIVLPFVVSGSYLSMIAYYFIFSVRSDRLIPLLDALRTPIDARRVKQIIAFDHARMILWLAVTWPTITPIIDFGRLSISAIGKFALYYLLFYSSGITQIMTLVLLHLCKQATLQRLSRIDRSISISALRDAKFALELRNEIGQIASVNRRLNRIFSFPLLCILVVISFNMMITAATTIAIGQTNWDYYAYITPYCVYITYIVTICERIETIRRNIVIKLMQISDVGRRESSMIAIGVSQCIELYRKYFQLQLFKLCTLGLRTLMLLVLFIINYVVLLTQTNE